MGDYGNIGKGIDDLLIVATVGCLVAMPFAIWKIAELIIAFFSHVRWQ